MELVEHHQIYYSNKNQIPIREVAASLVALEELIKRSPKVLEELFPDVEIQRIEVYLSELTTGSLWEDIVVKLVFGGQGRMDIAIDNLREKLGMDKVVGNSNLLSIILVAMILTGGYLLLDKSQDADRTRIENSIINVVSIGAEALGMESQDLRDVINNAVDKQTAIAATKVVRPAKADPDASIKFSLGGRKEDPLLIDSQVIRAMPEASMPEESDEDVKDYENLEIHLVATDLESIKKGWAVRIPEISERRIKLHLDPHIDPGKLFGQRVFHADATVMFRLRDGEMQPYLVFLREVLEQ